MKIFILDDDANIIRILKKIILDRSLGDVVGFATDGIRGREEIEKLEPDLVLIDLLLPGTDGISLVRELKKEYPEIEFIMISQVNSKDMVGKAYKSGVEYFIHKPINALEIESILKKVNDRMKIDRTFFEIRNLFTGKFFDNEKKLNNFCEQCIKKVLQRLGVMGEKGSQDIIDICKYVINNNINISDVTIRELCNNFSKNPKSMEQRMRRTISIAMSNIASLGIEDYMNENFVEYSSSLFNFEQVKREMDYMRGKGDKGGTLNMKKFITGLLYYCQNEYS